jgi:hypothetical protein
LPQPLTPRVYEGTEDEYVSIPNDNCVKEEVACGKYGGVWGFIPIHISIVCQRII